MTIKGTLETFNLRELLQMLAFNQKVGTLVLETEWGPRTIYVDGGRASFMEADPLITQATQRVFRRSEALDNDRLDRAMAIAERSKRFVGDVLLEMGMVDEENRLVAYEHAVGDRLFDAQLTAIQRFEFMDGEALNPGGAPGTPIEPKLPVEGLLLDLTRKIDSWQVLQQIIPSIDEVFEGTGAEVDLSDDEEIDLDYAQRVVSAIDGHRPLKALANATDVDLYNVAQIVAAFYQGGGIRPVPTADLLHRGNELIRRGEAEGALPLLRRAIDRGDAPSDTRLRLAEAYEMIGEGELAAQELDTFCALSTDADAASIFEALQRALLLRNGDLTSAARVCDYYLRHRPWLGDHKKDALKALNQLLDAASRNGQPLEAATRLAGFIEVGDAPSEELLVLADLYQSGGERKSSAGALMQRAEHLLGADRRNPARDMFRRVLELDPSRADARRRLMELDGETRRRRRKRRMTVVMSLFIMLVIGAGAAWWTYNKQAKRAHDEVFATAEAALRGAEEKATALVDDFGERIKAARTATLAGLDELHLEEASRKLVDELRTLQDDVADELSQYAMEIENYPVSSAQQAGQQHLANFDGRRRRLRTQGEELVASVIREASESLRRGEQNHRAGNFKLAEKQLVVARNLGFDDDAVRGRAEQLLSHVRGYIQRFKDMKREMDEAREADDLQRAFRIGVNGAVTLHKSDLMRTLGFPVQIKTEPAGAQVLLNGEDSGLVTPCILEYSPFQDVARLTLRLPGRSPASKDLPTWRLMERRKEQVLAFRPFISADLPAGHRWRCEDPAGRFRYLWKEGHVARVLSNDQNTVYGVDPAHGRPGAAAKAGDGVNPVRMAGMSSGGHTWRVSGHRTLEVLPIEQTETWTQQVVGRITHPPAFIEGRVIIADDSGKVYAFAVETGAEEWRAKLDAPPIQTAVSTPAGVLIGTERGSVMRLDLVKGKVKSILAPNPGGAYALPFGNAAAVIGPGETGVRLVRADESVVTVGAAAPLLERKPLATGHGIAWIEADGVRWLSREKPGEIQTVKGLGSEIASIVAQDATLFGADPTGVLRAASTTTPNQTLWAAPLAGAPSSNPIVLGNAVFILVDGDLVAVER